MRFFGDKIRLLRKSRKISQTELSAHLGFNSHSYLSELESGAKKPTAEIAVRLSYFFDVSIDYLLKDEIPIDNGSQN